MIYQNPIVQGFYPDPSVCFANGKYYMVCSSFQYFPGVPLFESNDLVNWQQLGHCLTRESQIYLNKIESSGGIYAPTIRYNEGIFYMVTTNATTNQNFYVWTEDIYSSWSDPIKVDQGGIDPSLYFENNSSYFMSNGEDDQGISGIVQCEIDISTGKKLSSSIMIWQGSGGRYLESPHLYKIGHYYYLLAAEGGTEYGHMVTYARGKSIFGPFTGYAKNPVLTNRNLGGNKIQGVGHGDLIQAPDGRYYLLHLAFRQTGQWTTFHHLGREVFITPISFQNDAWFIAGENGTTTEKVNFPHVHLPQQGKQIYTFENTKWQHDWCYLRLPTISHYKLTPTKATLKGTSISLNEVDSPTFIGLRQKDFDATITCTISTDKGEAGITLYMDENHHYDIAIQATEHGYEIIQRLCIGNIQSIEHRYNLGAVNKANLVIEANSTRYRFFVKTNSTVHYLGEGLTRYLSSEVAGGFTGVIIGLYAFSRDEFNTADFTNFSCIYKTNFINP